MSDATRHEEQLVIVFDDGAVWLYFDGAAEVSDEMNAELEKKVLDEMKRRRKAGQNSDGALRNRNAGEAVQNELELSHAS